MSGFHAGFAAVTDEDEGRGMDSPDETRDNIGHVGGVVLIAGVDFAEGIHKDGHRLEGLDERVEIFHVQGLENVEWIVC